MSLETNYTCTYVEKEQADSGRDGRICHARPEWDRKLFIFPVQLTTSRIGNLTAVSDDNTQIINGVLPALQNLNYEV